MTDEASFIAALRAHARTAAARGLADDAASFRRLVITHDALAEGVHYLPDDPPEDVAWKLVAVNLSDLAAKGARPLAVLTGHCLGDPAWDFAFARGLGAALRSFDVALLGGDAVALPPGAPRVLSLTAIGEEPPGGAPARAGAVAGDRLWVSGTIGDAGLGLRIARGAAGPAALLGRYRRPTPRVALGRALAPLVSAMMDVSDGLLIDADRLAAASRMRLRVDFAAVPLPPELREVAGEGRGARLDALSAGDDYELLFTAPAEVEPFVRASARDAGVPVALIGAVEEGIGLRLVESGEELALPRRLGYLHGAG